MDSNWTGTPPWRDLFAQLAADTSITPQRRGQQFEVALHGMFAEAGMEPRSRYRPKREEIDGSFLHRDRPMLLEAKWTARPVTASTRYQFRGKVDGKLTETIGVFISMGGYSDDAVDALLVGKADVACL